MLSISPKHILSINDIDKPFLDVLLRDAEQMKLAVKSNSNDYCQLLQNKVLACLFYEPSTRTSCSFQAAMYRLGGSVIVVNEQTSSAQKGETVQDTVTTLGCYCDALVIRHPTSGIMEKLSANSVKPIINAGDGNNEHPTQALLDVFTIKTELGDPLSNKMTITFLGDLKNSRTVHSLVHLLTLFEGVRMVFVSPHLLTIPDEIICKLGQIGIDYKIGESLEDAITYTDVLYVTRIQKERFSDKEEYGRLVGSYQVNTDLMKRAKQNMIVMHPLPRNDEIHTDVDADPRAAYIRQMENGMYMRMALLANILGTKEDQRES